MIDIITFNKEFSCPICGSKYFGKEVRENMRCRGCLEYDFKNFDEFKKVKKDSEEHLSRFPAEKCDCGLPTKEAINESV